MVPAPGLRPEGATVATLIHRFRESGYVKAWNDVLDNPELSLGARGLLVTMLRKPPGWEFSAERLSREVKEGVKTIRNYQHELRAAGYYYPERYRDGSQWKTRTWVSDESVSEWVEAYMASEQDEEDITAGRPESPSGKVGGRTVPEGTSKPHWSTYPGNSTSARAAASSNEEGSGIGADAVGVTADGACCELRELIETNRRRFAGVDARARNGDIEDVVSEVNEIVRDHLGRYGIEFDWAHWHAAEQMVRRGQSVKAALNVLHARVCEPVAA